MQEKKKLKLDTIFNQELFKKETVKDFSTAFKSFTANNSNLTQAFSTPFRHGIFNNIFSQSFINDLRAQVLNQEFFQKSNDLYEFFQSDDLKNSTNEAIVKLRESIYSPEFIKWMSDMTGFELSRTVDLSAHRYPKDGYLLCHDDDIGSKKDGRRIAFIIYLVESDWSASDGGMLQLYDTDLKNNPTTIIKSIVPTRNTFTFFEVSSFSHHQVQSVYKRDRVFHGPIPNDKIYKRIDSIYDHELITRYINPAYLDESSCNAISQVFEDESTVQLQKFLKPEKYKELFNALVKSRFNHPTGYSNSSRFHLLSDNETPSDDSLTIIYEYKLFFESVQFQSFLYKLTGIELNTKPYSSAIRQFKVGDYTLMNDNYMEESGLDVIFSIAVGQSIGEEWEDSWGGGMHYVADKDTLLSIYPIHNTLQLVYRDEGTLRFVKLLNRQAQCKRTEYSIVYTEQQLDK
ncbi:Prolyl 3-hydroxylase ogfod1 [Terramyces sp. JEL0728]|nr:Prolyl 3-hydroxylase ogfod1 [Terramyces sp. JEL0728]